MGDLSAQVLKSFGISAKRVIREKGSFIFDTPDGARMVYKSQVNGERILFQHDIKEHVINAGFPWVDRYMLSNNGEPYVMVGGDCYIMTPRVNSRETDFTDADEFLRAVEALARWHTAARRINFNGRVFTQPQPLTDVFAKQGHMLSSIRRQVNRQARLSDFDVLFIKHAGYYAQKIKDALNELTDTEYLSVYTQALTEHHICHNALKEESLPTDGENIFVTQYANTCADTQLSDLCGLIRRYAQKCGELPIPRIVETYSYTAPLTQGQTNIVHALLVYPQPFMKIVTQYYSKRRTWTPGSIISRMSDLTAAKDKYEEYLETLRLL